MARILIIEDEKKIARVLQLELEHEGYETDAAFSGSDGLETFQAHAWDLVLLDVMLPELSGLEVLRRIRMTDPVTPIILLTARNSIPDKVSGLDLGANDYITKPFEIEELLARVRACLRTVQTRERVEDTLMFQELTINEKTRDVQRGNETIELTPKEFELLVFFIKNKGQVLSREQILTNVWGFDYYGDTNVIDVYVRYLRKKLSLTEALQTVRGVGYRLKE
ncbi:response regulator transcription factor [Halalkalibacterium halodurans]|uniref:Two-component response regulator n=1 Tax=Halalkalibacterium halodurans (strain ATCC BAA-125 / DSM 18197 / FERM 7344 / JCM 9153 / C-125) TaxID=272558 RepID=Q9KFU9_HALH5|nr:response regulator transcription factor [Halalkalibacterium halodurans]MDY7220868.1 response regulator transcription factor [Halalkalibacterium halodurans]MDY7240107.1 response regulator transcription factor [Halalkalibacterium halodurans]MED4082574.1 response regulator transcription factor [Halalkalibacterium halodurans]MED4085819.1 response regulator transcription factor [Halalkalibacterium halodurans]MED4105685.1 response regulator transcription factor [Halalkalibacterium halodurans]